MPSGCEFSCANEFCDFFSKGFSIQSPWPLSYIDLVIDDLDCENYKELISHLLLMKKDGCKYACIKFPNKSNIPTIAYRFSFWSPQAYRIYYHDVKLEKESNLEKLLESDSLDFPNECKQTGCKLLNFKQVIEHGISCIKCKNKMKQTIWFTEQ